MVFYNSLQGICGQDRTVQLHGRQATHCFGYILFVNLLNLFQCSPPDHLGQYGTGRYCRGTTKCLKSRQSDPPALDLQVELEHIATGRIFHYAHRIGCLKFPYIARILIVVQDSFIVKSQVKSLPKSLKNTLIGNIYKYTRGHISCQPAPPWKKAGFKIYFQALKSIRPALPPALSFQ